MRKLRLLLIVTIVLTFAHSSGGQTIIPIYDSFSNGMTSRASTSDSSSIYMLYKFNDTTYRVTKYDGTTWTEIVNFTLPAGNKVYCIQVFQENLFFGGNFTSFMNIPNTKGIVEFSNGTFSSAGTGVNGQVNCMTVFQNNLIAGGYLSIPGGIPYHPLANWDGTNWTNVGPLISDSACGIGTCVNTLLPVENALYVGGNFNKTGSQVVNNVARWENNSWWALGNGIIGYSINSVSGFGFYNNELYTVYFEHDTSSGNNYTAIKKWDGSNWYSFLLQPNYQDDQYSCLESFDNKFFIGGYSNSNSGLINGGAIWNGTSFQHFSFFRPYSAIWSYITFHNKLYCAGWFSCTGDNIYHAFGLYDSTAMAIDEINLSNHIRIFPNPFSSATTLQSDNSFHNSTLNLYNCFGQMVKQIKNVSGATITLHRDNLQSGLYFYRLLQENKVIATDKLIITDN